MRVRAPESPLRPPRWAIVLAAAAAVGLYPRLLTLRRPWRTDIPAPLRVVE